MSMYMYEECPYFTGVHIEGFHCVYTCIFILYMCLIVHVHCMYFFIGLKHHVHTVYIFMCFIVHVCAHKFFARTCMLF